MALLSTHTSPNTASVLILRFAAGTVVFSITILVPLVLHINSWMVKLLVTNDNAAVPTESTQDDKMPAEFSTDTVIVYVTNEWIKIELIVCEFENSYFA